MKNVLFVALAFLATSTQSFASTGTLLHFFEALEGHWSGIGTERYFGENPVTATYGLDLGVDYAGNSSWRMMNTVHRNEKTETRTAYFKVLNNALWLDVDGAPARPVAIIESTPETLAYRYQIAQPTGRVYEYTLRLIEGIDGTLTGTTTVESGGAKLGEDHFSLKRR